jgi:hypothetical protein
MARILKSCVLWGLSTVSAAVLEALCILDLEQVHSENGYDGDGRVTVTSVTNSAPSSSSCRVRMQKSYSTWSDSCRCGTLSAVSDVKYNAVVLAKLEFACFLTDF